LAEYSNAKQQLGEKAKPVLVGPVSYLLLGKEKEKGFERIDLIKKLVPVYVEIINRLNNKVQNGSNWTNLAWRSTFLKKKKKHLSLPTAPLPTA
jgi:5-methyltetrahydropteroyltriglutamate--homocysteine methyltransferase